MFQCPRTIKQNYTKYHKQKLRCCIWQCFYSLFLSRVATYYVWGGRSTLSSGFIQIQYWYFRSAWSSGLIQTQYHFFKSTPSLLFLQIQFPCFRSIMYIARFYTTNTIPALRSTSSPGFIRRRPAIMFPSRVNKSLSPATRQRMQCLRFSTIIIRVMLTVKTIFPGFVSFP